MGRFAMSYSNDLRLRVVEYVQSGGLKTEAGRIFGVTRPTIYRWLSSEEKVSAPLVRTRKRKLDKSLLAAHVREHPDALLRERAEHFGVRVNAVWVALRRLDIRKKNDALCGNKSQ